MVAILIGLVGETRHEEAVHIDELEQVFEASEALKVDRIPRALQPGERAGSGFEFAQLAVTLLTSGAAIALIDCLRSYIKRDRRAVIRVKSGENLLEIDINNVNDPKLLDILDRLHQGN